MATGGEKAPRGGLAARIVLVEETRLKNPLDSLTGTIVCGVILTIILYFLVKAVQPVTVGG
jgi:hypothetical protein